MYEEKIPEDLKYFEAALASLSPRDDRLDRDRLVFLAGQHSALAKRRFLNINFWKVGFASMTAVSAVLMVMVLQKPNAQFVYRNVERTDARPMAATDAAKRYHINDLDEQYIKDNLLFKLAFITGSDNRKPYNADSSYSYPLLLRQIIIHGVDSWKPNIGGTVNLKTTTTRPLTNRELLEQYLSEPGMTAG